MAKPLGNYLLLGALALFLWFAVLRPLLRKHLLPAQAAPPVPGADAAPAEEAGPEAQAQAQAQEQQRQDQRHLENTKYAQEIAAKDPQVVAMLMKHWMNENNG